MRTQQGGEGGSTKSVLMRARGRGVSGALSAHAKSLHKGLDLLQEEIFDKKTLLVHLSTLSYFLHEKRLLCMDCNGGTPGHSTS